MEVQILSEKLIKPSSTTSPHDYNLTFFDQLAHQMHIRLIYFYSSFESDSNLKNLRESLSDALTIYPPFAGRFKEDGLTISCGGQGVLYFEAIVNENLDEFLPKAQNDRTVLKAYAPQDLRKVKSVTTPMLAIQVTSFKCGGLAIGIARSHALADAYSATTFFHHWAAIHRGMKEEAIINVPDFHSGYDLFPPNLIPMKPKPSFLKVVNKKILGKKIIFTEETILSLKTKMVYSSGRVSRVAIVMGTIWRSLINVSRAKNGYTKPSVLTLTFSLRGRNALIGKKTFGNAFTQVPIRFSANNYQKNFDNFDNFELLDHLVSLIRDGIQNIDEAFSKASTCHMIASLASKLLNEVNEEMENEKVDVFPFTSWCKFDPSIIDLDFGWGKPIWIGTIFHSEITSLMDTKCGTGIEARVHLNEDDMAAFECDQDIKPFI